jgi:hypothetical protein
MAVAGAAGATFTPAFFSAVAVAEARVSSVFLPVTVNRAAETVGVGIVLGRVVIEGAEADLVVGVVEEVPAELQAAVTRTRPTEPRVSPRRRKDVVITTPVGAQR